jgi:predicted NUDIX family NTP pyrophosphohydrolase
LYRWQNDSPEIFLVHPGGPFWAKKDVGAWSIPKGEYTEEEDAQLAARREFKEETGHNAPAGKMQPLGQVKYGNKIVSAWALEGDVTAEQIVSNTFSMKWPPRSDTIQEFPEVDRAAWFDAATAQSKLVKGQAELVERLREMLGMPPPRNSAPATQLPLL